MEGFCFCFDFRGCFSFFKTGVVKMGVGIHWSRCEYVRMQEGWVGDLGEWVEKEKNLPPCHVH